MLEKVALEVFTIGMGQSTKVLSGPGATILLKWIVGEGPAHLIHIDPGLVTAAYASLVVNTASDRPRIAITCRCLADFRIYIDHSSLKEYKITSYSREHPPHGIVRVDDEPGKGEARG
jgi:hypothetical protein